MIFLGDRVPFQRPVQAGPNFVPRSIDARMYSDIDPYPQFMPPVSAGYPPDVRLPLQAEPAGGAAPVAPASVPVAGFGAISPLALAQRAATAMPRGLQQRFATADRIRSRLSASQRVARGRNPGA
jgi:hypothetical protein